MFGGNWRRVSGGSARRSRSSKAYRYLQGRPLEVLAHSLLRHPTRETRVWTVVHLLLLLRTGGQFPGHLAAATVHMVAPLSAGRQFQHFTRQPEESTMYVLLLLPTGGKFQGNLAAATVHMLALLSAGPQFQGHLLTRPRQSTRQPEESTMLMLVPLSAGRQFLGQSGKLSDRRTKARDLFPARHIRHPASRLCRLLAKQKMSSIVRVAKAVYENLHENQEKPLVNPLASALVNPMEKKRRHHHHHSKDADGKERKHRSKDPSVSEPQREVPAQSGPLPDQRAAIDEILDNWRSQSAQDLVKKVFRKIDSERKGQILWQDGQCDRFCEGLFEHHHITLPDVPLATYREIFQEIKAGKNSVDGLDLNEAYKYGKKVFEMVQRIS